VKYRVAKTTAATVATAATTARATCVDFIPSSSYDEPAVAAAL
jgi:hypothetical protein